MLDTYDEFLAYWSEAKQLGVEEQIDLWETRYMARYPELLAKQQEDYTDAGLDWREIARERIFPHLEERLPLMTEARSVLPQCVGPTYEKARKVVSIDFDVLFVVYVGIGLGAGWATRYQSSHACLMGLENIAELGWTGEEALIGLVANELCHLAHQEWRGREGLDKGSGPLWQLYEEGFARRRDCEVVGYERGRDEWLSWCQGNLGWLASEFLRVVDEGGTGTEFFGSWYDIQGHRQTGYFLGDQVIRQWESSVGLREIAVLPWEVIRARARKTLGMIAERLG